MKNFVRGICLTSFVALAAGCASSSVEELADAEKRGTAFDQNLAVEYTKLARYEAEKMLDREDSAHFARKGKIAAQGRAIGPDEVSSRVIPKEHVGQLTRARASLIDAFNHDVKNLYPATAATAQAKYDCWLEQQEENYQPKDIASCKQEFVAAMRTIYKKESDFIAARDKNKPKAASLAGMQTLVFFDFDKYTIAPNEKSKLDSIADALKKSGKQYTISATGHADRVGSKEYNKILSMRRAQAVKAHLIARGVAPKAINVSAEGETEPRVETGDGVRKAENRRVNISVR